MGYFQCYHDGSPAQKPIHKITEELLSQSLLMIGTEISESKSGFINQNKNSFRDEYLNQKSSANNQNQQIKSFDEIYELVPIIVEELMRIKCQQ